MGTVEDRGRLWRSRWAAIGAAVAVTFGAGGLVAVNAAGGVDSTTVLTDPVRVLDSRDPTNVGLAGPFASQVSQKLQITGSINTTTGLKTVVPTGATGVLLNVTAVLPTANGFISIRPGDATGLPSTSSLNFNAGEVVPNAVTVALPTAGTGAGKIDITYDAYGATGPTTDILIDVVGYTSKSSLAAPVTMTQGPSEFTNAFVNGATTLRYLTNGVQVLGNGAFGIGLVGPAVLGGEALTLTSATYCIEELTGGAYIPYVEIHGLSLGQQTKMRDETDRTASGCYTVTPDAAVQSHDHFELIFVATGGGSLNVLGVTTTWGPRPA